MPLGSEVVLCHDPVISDERAAELKVSRCWCERHSRIIADAKRYVAKRPTRAAAPRPHAEVVVRQVEPTKPKPVRLTREERAAQLARAVHAAGHLTRDEAAQAVEAGSRRTFSRIVQHAVDAGWIVGRVGAAGGYVPGEVVPPAEE